MTLKRAAIAFTLIAALAVAVVPVGASDPIGIYCVVQRVVLEPNESAPERVQVWGAFSVADPETGGYTSAMKGYLYYADPQGMSGLRNHRLVTAEWADLKSVAGTGEVVGFGSRRDPFGRVRPATEKPGNPDPYPALNTGVVRLGKQTWASAAWYSDMAASLRKTAGR